MIAKKVIVTKGEPAPSAFGSNALTVGNIVYLAGCIGNDDQGKLVEGTIQDRTRRALFNAERRLQSVGLDLSDVVSVTIYLSKYQEDFASMNEAYISCFPTSAPMPVRTCVGVKDLPAGTDIELTCIAAHRQ